MEGEVNSKKRLTLISIIVVVSLLIIGGVSSYQYIKYQDSQEKIAILKDSILEEALCLLNCPLYDAKTASEKGLWNIREEAIAYGGLENMYHVEDSCYIYCGDSSINEVNLKIEDWYNNKTYFDERVNIEINSLVIELSKCSKMTTKDTIRNCYIDFIKNNYPQKDISNLSTRYDLNRIPQISEFSCSKEKISFNYNVYFEFGSLEEIRVLVSSSGSAKSVTIPRDRLKLSPGKVELSPEEYNFDLPTEIQNEGPDKIAISFSYRVGSRELIFLENVPEILCE